MSMMRRKLRAAVGLGILVALAWLYSSMVPRRPAKMEEFVTEWIEARELPRTVIKCQPHNITTKPKATICSYTNLCYSNSRGIFLLDHRDREEISASPLPWVKSNLYAADYDFYWAPTIVPLEEFGADTKIGYLSHSIMHIINEYEPHHWSHFLLNNALPLLSIIEDYPLPPLPSAADVPATGEPGGTRNDKDIPRFRDLVVLEGHYKEVPFTYDFVDIDHYFPLMRGLLKDKETTLCYAQNIAGLGNRCLYKYCTSLYKMDNVLLDDFRARARGKCDCTPSSVTALKQKAAKDTMDTKGNTLTLTAEELNRKPLIIIIQRKGTRKILNLHELVKVLRDTKDFDAKWDLRVEYMEDFTFCDQVQLFSDADVLIAGHGNAFGNLFWMEPGTPIIEIFGYKWDSTFFEILAKRTKHPYFPWFCRSPSCADENELASNFDAKSRSVYVNLEDFQKIWTKVQELFYPTSASI